MSIDLPKILLESPELFEVLRPVYDQHPVLERYKLESIFIGYLSTYALNKSKNVKKPKFQDQELIEVYAKLNEEFIELQHELKQKKIDYHRVLDEIADVAACCAGLLAWIMEHKDD